MMRLGRGSSLLRPLTEIQMQKKLQVRIRIISISISSILTSRERKALTCRSQWYGVAPQAVGRKSWQSEGCWSWTSTLFSFCFDPLTLTCHVALTNYDFPFVRSVHPTWNTVYNWNRNHRDPLCVLNTTITIDLLWYLILAIHKTPILPTILISSHFQPGKPSQCGREGLLLDLSTSDNLSKRGSRSCRFPQQ